MEAVLGVTTWRWGIGMWGIIFTVCCIPLVIVLVIVQLRAKRAGALEDHKTLFELNGVGKTLIALFWQLDVIGVFLTIAVFGLILTPLTLAGGQQSQWKTAKIIVPLVIGVCCIPAWVIWESKALHPMVPWRLLKGRGVWAAFGIAITLNFSWGMQGDYLYAVLQVAFNESIKSANRITQLYSFASVITGTILGFVVCYVKRLKWFIVFGTCLWVVAMGLLVRYRSGTTSHAGVVGAQVVLGIAGGMFSYTTQASVQAETRHEHVAVVTAIYLATYQVGSALAASISGAIWTQILPGRLERNLGDATSAQTMYADPYTTITLPEWAWGTEQRLAAVEAYQHVQKILCIVALCFGFLLILFGAFLRNRKMVDAQSRPDAELDSLHSDETSMHSKKRKLDFNLFQKD